MKIHLKKFVLGQLTLIFALACFALLPAARAVAPALDGGYPNQNTAEGEDTLFSLTTGADNTAIGFDALDSNTTESHTPLVSWIWRVTATPNTARSDHTATLLQNGMVLVAGGFANGNPIASSELYDPASRTWTATGSLNAVRNAHTATLLPNGMVLVAGGGDSNFKPPRATWTATTTTQH